MHENLFVYVSENNIFFFFQQMSLIFMFSFIISIISESVHFDFWMLLMIQPNIVRGPNVSVQELVIETPYLLIAILNMGDCMSSVIFMVLVLDNVVSIGH